MLCKMMLRKGGSVEDLGVFTSRTNGPRSDVSLSGVTMEESR